MLDYSEQLYASQLQSVGVGLDSGLAGSGSAAWKKTNRSRVAVGYLSNTTVSEMKSTAFVLKLLNKISKAFGVRSSAWAARLGAAERLGEVRLEGRCWWCGKVPASEAVVVRRRCVYYCEMMYACQLSVFSALILLLRLQHTQAQFGELI